MNREFVETLKGMNDIEIDTHSGSYELVRQGVILLSNLAPSVIDVSDLEMLFHFGNLKHGKSSRDRNIRASHLSAQDKRILLALNDKILSGDYTNSGLDDSHKSNGNCGLFAKGRQTLTTESNKATAQAFIGMLIDISRLPDSDTNKMFEIAADCLSKQLHGIGVEIASQMLHLLKPSVFPVLNSVGQEGYKNKIGLPLHDEKDIKSYIDNVKIIKRFRDTELPNFNYRTIDVAFLNITQKRDNINYWLGGATYSGGDIAPNFISHSVYAIDFGKEDITNIVSSPAKMQAWIDSLAENGARQAFKQLIQMEKGDRIAIKAAFAKGKTSILRIKAIGTILENFYDGYVYDDKLGHTIPVEWKPVEPNIDYEIGGYLKTLNKLSKQSDIEAIFNEDAAHPTIENEVKDTSLGKSMSLSDYTKTDFLEEVYIDSDKYDDICATLLRKKNIILQGAPGVGKSFIARRLAYAMMGVKDASRVGMVQFHQSYSYEDFIEGFRPNASGVFTIRSGIFRDFCQTAQKDTGHKYFFIIDEINRGNLSKIMGELMLLLEHDKRGEEFAIPLTYSGEPFYVPGNVYVIGMMNTADRSLAMIDYALRRRFSFVPIEPAFENERFVSDFRRNCSQADSVIATIKNLNAFICEELDEGHQIGHSYFCSAIPLNQQDIDSIFKYEIRELLQEYFFDDVSKLEEAKGLL